MSPSQQEKGAVAGSVGDFMGEGDEVVGRFSHCTDDDYDLVSCLCGTDGFPGSTEYFLCIGNASTAEFLNDERHGVIITERNRYESGSVTTWSDRINWRENHLPIHPEPHAVFRQQRFIVNLSLCLFQGKQLFANASQLRRQHTHRLLASTFSTNVVVEFI